MNSCSAHSRKLAPCPLGLPYCCPSAGGSQEADGGTEAQLGVSPDLALNPELHNIHWLWTLASPLTSPNLNLLICKMEAMRIRRDVTAAEEAQELLQVMMRKRFRLMRAEEPCGLRKKPPYVEGMQECGEHGAWNVLCRQASFSPQVCLGRYEIQSPAAIYTLRSVFGQLQKITDSPNTGDIFLKVFLF